MGRFHGLENMSLSVSKGEFICFLDPSGCGKTTLLRAVAELYCFLRHGHGLARN